MTPTQLVEHNYATFILGSLRDLNIDNLTVSNVMLEIANQQLKITEENILKIYDSQNQ